ncbi:MAG TPA: putative baseplate assembly protein [Chthoniobacterales bacterium]|nr:putative baseplate assembly protein [Chthoniobacterales bacterium]
MNYFCCDKSRRNLIEKSSSNGIDFLEVLDSEATSNAARQRTLYVHFINNWTSSPSLQVNNVRIEGGERIRGIKVTKVTAGSDSKTWEIEVDKYGDFSTYTLRIVQDATHDNPPPGIDPFFAAVEFSFKVECPSDFDCKPKRICPPALAPEPELDYLAKDYASFRQLMLDRMRVLLPQWRERNAADLGIALVELLAYAGDHLSYEQDAVATEAYLGTARRRVSVRRHARLVDYFVHDGSNARTWAHVQVSVSQLSLPRGTQLLSRIAQQPPRIAPNSTAAAEAFRQRPVVFETKHDALLFQAHNDLYFYTWGDDRCCLPRSATRATLADGSTPSTQLRLAPGDVLVFEERIGPNTGLPADADPAHRHAVRLTQVSQSVDPLNGQPVVAIEWAADDALPFALCLSSVSDKQHLAQPLQDVSIAHGNIILADHGLTVPNEPLGVVPRPEIFLPPVAADDRCSERDRIAVPPRFRPRLQEHPLTHAAPFVFPPLSATAALRQPARELLPSITLNSDSWRPQYDLLGSDADAHEFVVETENDGTAFLRFGDDEHGIRPKPGTIFAAHYRVGNGTAGNVGADSLVHIVSSDSGIISMRNPMPARGGVEPETIEDIRQRAPSAFRTQERAVTEADYAEVTERDARVQQAAATFRWTGSWHTVFLTIDRFGGLGIDAPFKKAIEAHVDRFRMAGHDLELNAPHFVSLEIEMHVCVKPGYFRSEVKAALLDLFSNRVLPDGRRGLFHPDNFSFGQTVYLSPLYAAAQAVPGVASVQITTFRRQGSRDTSPLDNGFLKLGRLEIARLDNDRNFAERGLFNVTLGGGK